MARKLFYDDKLQHEFDKKGYVILDLMDQSKFNSLLSLYDEIEGVKGTLDEKRNSYELSFFDKDPVAKKRKFKAINDFFAPILAQHIIDYKPIIINLFNKEQGKGEVPVHQNWTFVDELLYTSVSVWCPLQDVTRENGTLEVVPGSHKIISEYRGPSIPWVFDEINDVMKAKYMVPLELHRGQVAIIDDGVIHYSGVNHSPNDRKAVQLIMKPREVPTLHCVLEDAEREVIEILEVDDDFFFDFDMTQKPTSGTRVKHMHYPIFKITESELVQMCRKNLNR